MDDIYREKEIIWKEYSLVEHLKNVCNNNVKYKNLYAVWTLDKETHSRALAGIYYNFPHYSMHDESHSLSIINKIEMILGEERIKSLSPTDTFLILESAYLHDIGMVIAHEELLKDWKEPTFKIFLKDLKENSYDKDVIEAATYLLKMQEEPNSFKENDWPVKVKDSVTKINSEYYRSKHSIRSANFINDGANIGLHLNYKKLIPNRLIELLQKIAVSHGVNFEDAFNELEHIDNGIATDIIHPRFISCLLRLGDLLDLDDGRFNSTFEKVALFPNSSKVHKEKHKSITLFLVSPNKIQVSAVCTDTEVYRETRAWFDWLKEEIKNLSSRWSDIVPKGFKGGPPSLGNIKLSIKGSENITEQLDLQFNINQKRAFELIEGQGIYSDNLIFIRELIQNAMDATKIQIWKDIKNGKYKGMSKASLGISEEKLQQIKDKKDFEYPSDLPEKIKEYYPINIDVDYNEENEELSFSIEDRGCGISIEDLKRMENVGGSWNQDKKTSELIEEMPEFLRPTGNFGLGIHSVFMVTDKLKIETKSEDHKAYDIEFVSGKNNGYITVEESENKKIIGSEISLKIHGESEINRILEYKCNRYVNLKDKRHNHIKTISENTDILIDSFDNKFISTSIKNKITECTKEYAKEVEILNIFLNKDHINKDHINKDKDEDDFIKIDEYIEFRLSNKNLFQIDVKDKKEGLIINIKFNKNSSQNLMCKINFKDISCIQTRSIDNFFQYEINIYKGDAKSILDVARYNINISKLEAILNRIENEIMPEVIKKISEEIENMYLIGSCTKNDFIIFLFAYYSYIGEFFEFKDSKISEKIIMGNIWELDYDKKDISPSIINYPKLSQIDEIIDFGSIHPNEFKNYTKCKPAKYVMQSIYVTKLNLLFNKFIYENFKTKKIFRLNNKTVYLNKKSYNDEGISFDNIQDRNDYIRTIPKSKNRSVILPLCEKNSASYKILFVNKIPKNLLVYPLEYTYIVSAHYSNCIISPIYNLKENYLKEEKIGDIIDFIKRERNFNELINWVAENSILKEDYKGSKEDIKKAIENAYIELIKEFMDVAKEEPIIEKINAETEEIYFIEEIAATEEISENA